MAEGRWDAEVVQVHLGAWGSPAESTRLNPYRPGSGPRPVTAEESAEGWKIFGAFLGHINEQGGAG